MSPKTRRRSPHPSKRSLLHRGLCLLLSYGLALAGCGPTSIGPRPGMRDYQLPAYQAVPGGVVDLMGGNLVVRQPGLALDTRLGTREVAAVYNSATGAWSWNLDMSYDGGKSWIKLDAEPVGQFYAIELDMAKPYNIYGGLQDNGSYKGSSKTRWELGQRWRRIGGGDGMYVQVDPRDNQTTYSGFQFGFYNRQGKGGRQSVRPRDKLKEPALRYNWQTPIELSAHNPDILYFGANRLFRSMDQGESFEPISEDLTSSELRGDVPFATIATLDESPEPLVGGVIDIGEAVTQQLVLALDPYPRKPGAVPPAPMEGDTGLPENGPFAALSALKKDD